jgi:hypothetical protein
MLMRNAIKIVGLALVLTVAACGEDGAGSDVGAFVGTWRPTAGGIKTTCPGAAPTTERLGRELVWSTGTSSGLTSVAAISPCRVKADVVDAMAIGIPDDHCRYAEGAGTSTVTLRRYAFSIASDGRSGLESASGRITHADEGVATSCAFEEIGTYEKIAD